MFHKTLNFILLLPFILNSNKTLHKAAVSESIAISGSITMQELHHELPITLKMDEGHPYAFVNINIYVNDILAVSTRELTKYISQSSYNIEGFTTPAEVKKIKISVNYLEENVADSICIFDIYAPKYGEYELPRSESSDFFESAPVRIDFSMKGDRYNITNYTEGISFNGKQNISLSESRFLDFSMFSFSLIEIDQEIENCEIRIYKRFENSDLLYKNDYTSFDVSLIKKSENEFVLKNEYKYFIDNTGMINETQKPSCDDEMLPFFFPLSFGTSIQIPMEIYLNDIGKHHSTYIYKTIVDLTSDKNIDKNIFGGVLNYQYVPIYEEIKGVKYE